MATETGYCTCLFLLSMCCSFSSFSSSSVFQCRVFVHPLGVLCRDRHDSFAPTVFDLCWPTLGWRNGIGICQHVFGTSTNLRQCLYCHFCLPDHFDFDCHGTTSIIYSWRRCILFAVLPNVFIYTHLDDHLQIASLVLVGKIIMSEEAALQSFLWAHMSVAVRCPHSLTCCAHT